MLSMGVAGLILTGCTEPDNPEPDTPAVEVPPPPDLPILTLVEPARAAWSQGAVAVRGTAEAGTGALESLVVDGTDMTLDARGGFELVIDPPPGLLLLGSRLTDALGERAVDTRSVHVGPVRPPGDPIEGAAWIELGHEFLDDNDPDADDIASVVERVASDPSFSAALVGQSFGESVPVTLTRLTNAGVDVDIAPQDGTLYFDLRLAELSMGFTASPLGVDVVGSTTCTEARVDIDIEVDSGPDGVVVDVTAVDVRLVDFHWSTDVLTPGIENALAPTIRSVVEQSLEDAVAEQIPTLVGGLLQGFAFGFAIGETTSIDVALDVGDIRSHPTGLVLRMDAAVSAPDGMLLPEGAGSLRTDSTPPPFPTDNWQPITLALDDDFVNQLLFATWHAGALSGLSLSGTELVLLTGEDLPPPLGPVEGVTVDLRLPPVLTPTRDLGGDGIYTADLSIGGLVLDITRSDGTHVETSLGVRAGVDLSVGNGGIDLDLDNRPTAMIVQAGVTQFPEGLDPGNIASLFRLSAPGLVGGALDFLPPLPTPGLDLGALTELDSLQGVTWEVSQADVAVREDGWLVITGRME